MSRDSIHQRIDELLGLLSIHNSRLSLHTERLSQLDIDVLRKQCIDLYDQVNMLALQGKIKSHIPKVAAQKQEVTPAAPIQTKPEEQQVAEAVKAEEVAEPIKVAAIESPKEEKNEAVNPKKSAKPVAEDEMLSLFEKFSSKPIASIPKAISVAKRFEFQSAFFDGEASEYNGFMAKLDAAEHREEAFEIYREYKVRLRWDNEELKDELKALMYRKYA
ncbi:MAG TPA: hypothetical protein DCX01_06130 [Bacteroidetes bacterium]|nr:hypothetical protein [Bacteroidota bacterium]